MSLTIEKFKQIIDDAVTQLPEESSVTEAASYYLHVRAVTLHSHTYQLLHEASKHNLLCKESKK